ncbi:MAG: M64 family metallopeptidase [Planctomycetota bacterium]|nr:M64 family metallopeptidase [Planctomycetota bacterium]
MSHQRKYANRENSNPRSEMAEDKPMSIWVPISVLWIVATLIIAFIYMEKPSADEPNVKQSKPVKVQVVDFQEIGGAESFAKILELPESERQRALEEFVVSHPEDRRAQIIQHIAEQSKKLNATEQVKFLERFMTAAKSMESSGLFAGSHDLLLISLQEATDKELKRRIEVALKDLNSNAQKSLDQKLADLTRRARVNPRAALFELGEIYVRFRGFGFDVRLARFRAELERQFQVGVQGNSGAPGALALDERRALKSGLNFRFRESLALFDSLIAKQADSNQSFRLIWYRGQISALQELFKQAVAKGRENTPPVPSIVLPGNLWVRLVGATDLEIELRPRDRGTVYWRWQWLTTFQFLQLVRNVGKHNLNLSLAKAFLAFQGGLPEQGFEILLWHARKKDRKTAVDTFYSLISGITRPKQGFVIFRKRLVTPKVKADTLALEEAARRLSASIAKSKELSKQRQKLLAMLVRIQEVMHAGQYIEGKSALKTLARRYGHIKGVGDVALARLESPVLRRRDLRKLLGLGQNGRSSNRLDLYILNDGYLLDPRSQEGFDRSANALVRILSNQSFFKEYDAYINYWVVNLESRQEGVSVKGVTKDTALGSSIVNSAYIAGDRGRIRFLLDTNYPKKHDNIALIIGNVSASIATGGGGIAALPKTALSSAAHELGHAFGNLADEYDKEPRPNVPSNPYTGGFQVISANVVAAGNRKDLKGNLPWQDWIQRSLRSNWARGRVDVFQGANRQLKGYWRPQVKCTMRSSVDPFCVVCMEVMVRKLYSFAKQIDNVWPANGLVLSQARGSGQPVTVRAELISGKSQNFQVRWYLDAVGNSKTPSNIKNKPMPGRYEWKSGHLIHSLRIQTDKLPIGRYKVRIEVTDMTPWVLEKNRSELRSKFEWTLTVQ